MSDTRYSATWFAHFLERIPSERNELQAAFLERELPLASFPRVLDVACGPARHAALLAGRGYRVTGVDVDRAALELARTRAPNATFVELDMRELDRLQAEFDAVLCLWSSFGWFDERANRALFASFVRRLRPGGKLVLEVYAPNAWKLGETVDERGVGAERVRTRTTWTPPRLVVELEYGASEDRDRFDWRLYSLDEWRELARFAGAELTLAATEWNPSRPPTAADRHVQLIFERRAI